MLSETRHTPLYKQLYQEMLAKIVGGQWPANHKLPSELELCQEYGVSRMTVRQAMELLKAQGYLYRKQGRGTFVRAPAIECPLTSLYSFSDQPEGSSEAPESLLLSFQAMPCAPEIAKKLKIPMGEEVFRIERIRLMGGSPFVYEFSYLPCARCPGLTADSIRHHGLYRSLQILCGRSPDTARESFQAIAMDRRSARHLSLPPGEPALKIERIASQGDLILEYCISVVKGDRIKYEVILNKKPEGRL